MQSRLGKTSGNMIAWGGALRSSRWFAVAWIIFIGLNEMSHLALSMAVAQQPGSSDVEEEPPAKPPMNSGTPQGETSQPAATNGKAPKLDVEEEEEPPAKAPAASSMPQETEDASSDAKPPANAQKTSPPSGLDVADDSQSQPNSAMSDLPLDADPELADAILHVCDRVELIGRIGPQQFAKVLLFPHKFQVELSPGQTVAFDAYVTSGKAKTPAFAKKDIKEIVYYEPWMLKEAAKVMGVTAARLRDVTQPFDLEKFGIEHKANVALEILRLAISEHDSAVQRNLRRDSEWAEQELRTPLLYALLNLEVSRLNIMVRQDRDGPALAECDRLHTLILDSDLNEHDLKSLNGQLLMIHNRLLLEPAQEAFAAGNMPQAREWLSQLTSRHPRDPGPAAAAFRQQMIDRADGLVDQAARTMDPREALRLLDEAAKTWPASTRWREERMRVLQEKPILECAYTSLPRNFSPLKTRTPVERHAQALLFEGLVEWQRATNEGGSFYPQLAIRPPQPLERGRVFELPLCAWSDSPPDNPIYCTVEDVRWTVELLRRAPPVDYAQAWQSLMRPIQANAAAYTRVPIQLTADYWRPMALMDFMILPRHYFSDDNLERDLERFNQDPVGTGPYRLLRESARTQDQVRFTANPNYRKEGLPKIHEIVMNRLEPERALELFLTGEVQLIWDVRPEHVNRLKQQLQRIVTTPNNSVYFLAPRYAPRAPMENENLRLAIAHVIDRKRILDQYFRPGGHAEDHAELTGPFPRRSWASNPAVGPFEPGRAAAYAEQARKELGGTLPQLTLIYPSNDPTVEAACKEIQRQTEGIGIRLKLEPVQPTPGTDFTPEDAFLDRVADGLLYDLAYWRQDYPNDAYWIDPLFQSNEAAAFADSNILHYVPDSTLQEILHNLRIHKNFPVVRQLTHDLHKHVSQKAIVIPLWQLDTYVAVHSALSVKRYDPLQKRFEANRVDPIRLFGDVEHWEIHRQ